MDSRAVPVILIGGFFLLAGLVAQIVVLTVWDLID